MEKQQKSEYESPTITRVELRVGEAVLEICKTDSGTGPAGLACSSYSCSNDIGS